MATLLLQAGADPNLSSRGDGNALIIAAQQGDVSFATLLWTPVLMSTLLCSRMKRR